MFVCGEMEKITDKKVFMYAPDLSNKEYFDMELRACEKYLNDVLETKCWLTWENICSVLHITTVPEEIEKTEVLRYTGKKLYIRTEFDPVQCAYMVRFYLKNEASQ